MPEPADLPAPPLRTWRPMAAWTAAILLALGLAWFVGAVVVPVWETRRAITGYEIYYFATKDQGYRPEDRFSPILGKGWVYPYQKKGAQAAIEKLGGSASAVRRISTYTRLPSWLAPCKAAGVSLLGYCEGSVTALLLQALKAPDASVRAEAARVIGSRKEQAAIADLVAALDDSSDEVRAEAASALGKIPGARESAALALMRLLKDENADVRFRAALALHDMGVAAPGADNDSLSTAAKALIEAHTATVWKKIEASEAEKAKREASNP